MVELKWCERCEDWWEATPRRCPKCSAKWALMAVQARRSHKLGDPWPEPPQWDYNAPRGSQAVLCACGGFKHKCAIYGHLPVKRKQP